MGVPPQAIPLFYALPQRACAYQPQAEGSNHVERSHTIFEQGQRVELRRLETFFHKNGRPQLVIKCSPSIAQYLLVADVGSNEVRALHYKWCEVFMRSYKPGLPSELQGKASDEAAVLREQIYTELRKQARGWLTVIPGDLARSQALVAISSFWPPGRPP
jgi:hypothetical protein